MRQCGDCQLCCKLLPVADGSSINGVPLPGGLHKKAGVRCPHQKHGLGCKVHGTERMPVSCSLWNCRWLVNDDTGDLQRPDRAHYVIDLMPDVVAMTHNETGEKSEMEAIQVWIDPAYPDAHRDPAFRRYLDRQGKPALIRFNERDSIFLAPPSVTGDGTWFETAPQTATRTQATTLRELSQKLGYKMVVDEGAEGEMRATRMIGPDGKERVVASGGIQYVTEE